jgi:hypothetical protein
MEKLFFVPTLPLSSASHSSSTPLNINARLIIPPNMPVHGVAPPIMEPAHKSVFEVSTMPQPFLEMPLTLAPFYRDWQSPIPASAPLALMPHIYFNNLQIEQPSPYDNDLDYSKIITPYSATISAFS